VSVAVPIALPDTRGVRAIVLAVVLSFGLGAHADDREAAKRAYREGTRLYDVADFRGALEAFKKAYLNFEEPTILFNIGQCYRQLGEKSEAIRFYRTYLRNLPDSSNADEVKRIITTLEHALAEERAEAAAREQAAKPSPAPVVAPAVAPSPANEGVVQAPAKKPIYKKGWFWGLTAAVLVVAGVAVGVGVAESQPSEHSFAVHVP
jgi:tetratricopeptide (TPR) repeat protein